jgi:predicted nuclease with TOPRIM domain
MDKHAAEALEARLAETSKRIKELQARLGTVQGEVKAELERRIDAVAGDHEAQRQRLHQLKDAGLEHWDDLKEQASQAWEDLEKSLQDLAARLKR